MGSSQSKTSQVKPARSQKVCTPPKNTYLAGDSFGYTVHFDEFMFKSQHIGKCYLCNKYLAIGDEIVFHNTERCKGAFHGHCIRRWLPRFIDTRGRHSRPNCAKCNRQMNIRLVRDGRTKRNPMGDLRAF